MSRRRNLLIGWPLAVAAMVLFANLGLWQSRRAAEKQAMLDAAQAVLAERRPAVPAQALDPGRARGYDWVELEGGFAPRRPLLLDNQIREGRPGVRVYRMFHPRQHAEILIDLGWLPVDGNRTLPVIGPAEPGPLRIRGLLAPPPSPGLALGPPMVERDGVWLMTRLDMAAVKEAIGDPELPLAPRVLRLDPQLELGYERDLELLANTLPPEKHRGYAVQWFALALAVLATALILTFRRKRTDR
ncbi:SURF1 family protein [Marilutibacter chinensis]|uniref:SURF1-like protein n=1 Tax=Marilutibacter chinensis TaxID=2912247 RepID=A0ABS9HVK8_9GAMM|nr:SURF1 family protein [Lysobacter chinensis]MCF7222127.1 SURF1 family protein [Lysobacter chinensis]